MGDTSSTPIVAAFGDHTLARDAILGLESAGIEPDAISVLARAAGEARSLDLETGASRDLEGVTTSHRVHDVLDWLASIGGALPGFGPVAGTGNLGLEVARARTGRGAVTARWLVSGCRWTRLSGTRSWSWPGKSWSSCTVRRTRRRRVPRYGRSEDRPTLGAGLEA